MTNDNNRPAAIVTGPESDERRPLHADEPATSETEEERESPSPAPGLLMFNTSGEGICTDDGCMVTFTNTKG
jgi:hypothetical protein